MENSENSETEERRNLFARCIGKGMRDGAETGESWTEKTFTDAVIAVRHPRVIGFHTRTYGNWLKGLPTNGPTARAMIAVFYGDNPKDPDAKRAFAQAWLPPARLSGRRGGASNEPEPTPVVADLPLERATEYRLPTRYTGTMIPEPTPPDPGHPLFEFKIDMPPQNSTEHAFDLLVDLLPQAHRDPQIAHDVGIGLYSVTLQFESETCDTVGQRAGDNNTAGPGIRRAARGWRYVASNNRALSENFNDVLARFQWNRLAAPPSLTLTAWAHAEDLRPVLLDVTSRKRTPWDTVREQYLVKLTRDGLKDDRIIQLGTASLRWKPKS